MAPRYAPPGSRARLVMPISHDEYGGGVPDVAASGADPGVGADLDLRLVRYFSVVAEHLNFGRAAAVLHVAQPSLSRQIQRLEDQLGVRLLDRTPQGSRLTEAGHAFLPHAQALSNHARTATRSRSGPSPSTATRTRSSSSPTAKPSPSCPPAIGA